MIETNSQGRHRVKHLWRRLLAGFGVALGLAVSAYMLIDSSSAANGFGGLWFLAILPTYLCALICYIGDPYRDRPRSFYIMVPGALVAIVVVGSVAFLKEGVICLLMLSPLWLLFGWLGAYLVRRARKQSVDPNIFRSSMLVLPLLFGGIEGQIPVEHDRVTLTREIVINATPAEIWPYTVANPHISEDEGDWTFTHNVVGLARPRATTVDGTGIGAVRTAYWGDKINFEEIISEWQPGHSLRWTFAFKNSSLQDYTDKHIAPDGPLLKLASGGYTLTPLANGTTMLTLDTHYIAKTRVNLYAEMWGQLFLGDVQSNVLTIIKRRVEKRYGRDSSSTLQKSR